MENVHNAFGAVVGGSVLLYPIETTPLTDANPVLSFKVETRGVNHVLCSVQADKNCNCVITPIDDVDAQSQMGLPSDTLVVVGGAPNRGMYESIGSPFANVTVTKVEAGDMTNFSLAVRGL